MVGYDSETGPDLSQLGADEINHLDGSMLDWVNAGGNLDFPDTISFNVSSYIPISHTMLSIIILRIGAVSRVFFDF